jgi:hypothetical protein
MTTSAALAHATFTGAKGRLLAALLQLSFVRYRRVQRGFAERPRQYEQFLATVVSERIEALGDCRLGVFGVGVHTQVALTHIASLRNRLHCFTDNNAALWHQHRFGRIVLPPREAVTVCDAFFLSTAVFQRVLTADLRALGFRGPIVAVDDSVPAGWFLR